MPVIAGGYVPFGAHRPYRSCMGLRRWLAGFRLRRRYRPITDADWALLEPHLRERAECTGLFVKYGLLRVPMGDDLPSVRVREALGVHFPDYCPPLPPEQTAQLPPTLHIWTLAPNLLAADAFIEPSGDTDDADRLRLFLRRERGGDDR